jgi:hypothetical protein
MGKNLIEPTRVRIDPAIRARMDRFQINTHRNMTGAINFLLEQALDAIEAEQRLGDQDEVHLRAS